MSTVLTIKRLPEKPALNENDFLRIVLEYEELSGGDKEPIIWGDVKTGYTHVINIDPESGSLWTDDFLEYYEGAIELFMYHLRCIALALDARVYDEAGEDVTDELPVTKPQYKTPLSLIVFLIILALTGMTYLVEWLGF